MMDGSIRPGFIDRLAKKNSNVSSESGSLLRTRATVGEDVRQQF